ncbi:MAG: prolipoprotein diacylglyceryl transferase family protein [Polyangiaceae bacterium]
MGPTFPFVFVDTTRTFGAQPFGFLVGLGVVVGEHYASKRAKALGYDPALFRSFIFWEMFVGMFCAHALDAIFYHPDALAKNPFFIFKVFDGLSSFGGFIGALLGALGWSRITFKKGSFIPHLRERALPLLPFAECTTPAFVITFAIGRLGCALVHDHPGALAERGSAFSVDWPVDENDGVHHIFGPFHFVHGSIARYDLGLLELLFLLVMVAAVLLTWKRRMPLGSYIAMVALSYSPVRFCMDFLRRHEGPDSDATYGALTFAQYACIAFFALGLYFTCKIHASRGAFGRDSEIDVSAPKPE